MPLAPAMPDPFPRLKLFKLLTDLPAAQFSALVFALKPPPGNVSPGNTAQAQRVEELLLWAESPIGCGLQMVATLTGEMFELAVPDFGDAAGGTPAAATPEATAWKESLGNGVFLEMVNIPAGRFWMGSLDSEKGRFESEGPVHSVMVPAFAMGKYPVTQAQWSEVAAMPQVQMELPPFPARFRGANRPVEQVSWHMAVEFCERLSRYTGRAYRLPSEAEWEYACRARTATPFYFGDTITPDQVNYNGNFTYGVGSEGIYRQQTTDVGSFPANAFGLFDLHGNVLEWCQDVWHGSYDGAPKDGIAWMQGGRQGWRVFRGGSWAFNPGVCRSAYRDYNFLDFRDDLIGFRVVCSSPRTL